MASVRRAKRAGENFTRFMQQIGRAENPFSFTFFWREFPPHTHVFKKIVHTRHSFSCRAKAQREKENEIVHAVFLFTTVRDCAVQAHGARNARLLKRNSAPLCTALRANRRHLRVHVWTAHGEREHQGGGEKRTPEG